jgi:hypothetical protein
MSTQSLGMLSEYVAFICQVLIEPLTVLITRRLYDAFYVHLVDAAVQPGALVIYVLKSIDKVAFMCIQRIHQL